MELWNEVIHTAMLGTDKKSMLPDNFSDDFAGAVQEITNNTLLDKEEKFLQLASVIFNYRQSAVVPVCKKEINLSPAPEEEKQYCSNQGIQVLQDILSEESIPLLKFWLQCCAEKQLIVHPSVLPTLFTLASQHKTLQPALTACCGKRGEWLSRFNDAWNFSVTESEEELWETGTPEQRKIILKTVRKKDPALAREWLQKTWLQEDAGTRTVFLQLFNENIGTDDIAFLEQALADKSKKVKEEALSLLKRIPASTIVKLYEDVLKQCISLKKEKVMLGLSSKKVLDISITAINEEIFKTGIQKVSSQKNTSDEHYIIFQLISVVPPSFLEKHLEGSPSEIINWFGNSTEGKELLPAIAIAAERFSDSKWANTIIADDVNQYFDLIPLLSDDNKERYLLKNFSTAADTIIDSLITDEKEWSYALTKEVFRHTARHPYQYTRSFYNTNIQRFPVQIVGELERCTPSEDMYRIMWSTTSDYIMKLVSLKIQTINAFQK